MRQRFQRCTAALITIGATMAGCLNATQSTAPSNRHPCAIQAGFAIAAGLSLFRGDAHIKLGMHHLHRSSVVRAKDGPQLQESTVQSPAHRDAAK